METTEEISEKKELLKRIEVRTMRKDIESLREEEAKEEQKRIAELKLGKETSEKETKEAEKTEELTEREKAEEKAKNQFLEIMKRKEELKEREESEKGEAQRIEIKRWGIAKPSFDISNLRFAIEKKEREVKKKGWETEERETQEILQTFPEKKKPLEFKKAQLFKQREDLEKTLAPILEKEKEIEEKKTLLEEEERKTESLEKKRVIEQERWGIENERKRIENEKWVLEEKISQIEKQMGEVEIEYQEILSQEKGLKEKQKGSLKKVEEMKIIGTKPELERKLQETLREQELLGKERNQLLSEKKGVEENLFNILKKEKEIEEELKAFEEEEKLAKSFEERQKVERERQEVERERQETEKERWAIEEEKEKVESRLRTSNLNYQKILEEIRNLKGQIEKIKALTAPEVGEVEKREFEPRIEEEKKKEEIKEEEVLEEIEEEKIEPELEKRKEGARKPAPKVLPEVRPLSFREKVFVRGAIIVILALVFTNLFLFWYWYLRQKIQGPPRAGGPAQEAPATSPPPEGTPLAPISLIPTKTKEVLEISSPKELSASLAQLLGKSFEENEFVGLSIKNTEENKFLGLKEFFEALEIKAPESFYEYLLTDEFILFIFPQKEGKRLGFVAFLKMDFSFENLTSLLESWEKTMEGDFENLFSLMGKENPALVSYFRETSYQNLPFPLRYQTFTRQDMGICYSMFSNLFIFTSSLQSLKSTLDYVVMVP